MAERQPQTQLGSWSTMTSLEMTDLTAEQGAGLSVQRLSVRSCHPFIPEIFVGSPLCVEHCSRHKRCSRAQNHPPSAL